MFDLYGNPALGPSFTSRGTNPQGGKTFYVDERAGNNGHEGTDPDFPLADLVAAYAKCKTGRGDYIFVQDFWTPVPATPLVIAITDVHLISLGNGNFDNGNDIDGGILASIELAEGCNDPELAGFNLGNDGSAVALDVTGQVSRAHIHHCTFGWNYPATEGIYSTPGGALLYPSIDHCYFGPNCSLQGINAYLNTGLIAHNIFRNPGVGCILLNGFGVGIFGNMMFSPKADSLLVGWAVHLDANTYENWVYHNWAAVRGDSAPTNPYQDQSAAAVANSLNGWADNFQGPALSGGPDP